MKFLIIAAVVVIVLFALAWWSSGRSKGSTGLGRRERNDAEANTMSKYRPSSGGSVGGGIGGGGPN